MILNPPDPDQVFLKEYILNLIKTSHVQSEIFHRSRNANLLQPTLGFIENIRHKNETGEFSVGDTPAD